MIKLFLSTNEQGVTRAERQPDHTWRVETLLAGQKIACLAADPLAPGVLYAGTRAGLLFSADSGRSWSPSGLEGQVVKAVAASPRVPGLLFAGTKPACLFVSKDGGLNWQELSNFRRIFSRRFWFSPAELPFSAYVQGIALSPTDPDILVVGIEAGAVVRSTDGGATWQDHRPGALRDCHSIIFHPTDGNWVYEGGGTGAGVAVSRDAGEHWTQPRAGLDRHYGWACAVDPLNPHISYVSISPSPAKAHGGQTAEACIFRSNENGEWQKLSGGLPQPLTAMPYALLTHPSEPGSVYAGLSNGDVWHSMDRGETWERLPFNLKSIHRTLIML